MAVVIRLSRRGAKKRPFYRVVAADSRSPRDGKFLEILGTFDPLKEEDSFNVDADKAKSWILKGGGLESSGQRLVSTNVKIRRIISFDPYKKFSDLSYLFHF